MRAWACLPDCLNLGDVEVSGQLTVVGSPLSWCGNTPNTRGHTCIYTEAHTGTHTGVHTGTQKHIGTHTCTHAHTQRNTWVHTHRFGQSWVDSNSLQVGFKWEGTMTGNIFWAGRTTDPCKPKTTCTQRLLCTNGLGWGGSIFVFLAISYLCSYYEKGL